MARRILAEITFSQSAPTSTPRSSVMKVVATALFFRAAWLRPTARPSRRASPRPARARFAEPRLDMGEAPFELGVGAAQRRFRIDVEWRARLATREQQIADLAARPRRASLASISASTSSISSRILAITARASFQSKPTLPAFSCSFSARVSAGMASGTPASAPAPPRGGAGAARASARSRFSSALMRPHSALTSSRRQVARVAEHMRMAADHLARDRLDDAAEVEAPFLLRHPRMKDHLQQQVAEFVAQVAEIAALDRVGDLVGLLDRVGRDGRESLLEVPRAAGPRRPQRRHDLDEAADIARWLHGEVRSSRVSALARRANASGPRRAAAAKARRMLAVRR